MVPQSVLVVQPAVMLQNLVGACSEIMGHNVVEAVDASVRKLSDAEIFLSVLSAIKEPGSPTGLPADMLGHVKFSVLTVADERDMLDVVAECSGMEFVIGETKMRGIQVAVISGTLDQWRDAISRGCSRHVLPGIRAGFNQLHGLFVGAGLGDIWHGFRQHEAGDKHTFLLTDER